jgi:hypothetical protein
MEGVKVWLSCRQQTSFTQAYKNIFPDTTSASILMVTMLRNSPRMYIFVCLYVSSQADLMFAVLKTNTLFSGCSQRRAFTV